MSSICVVVIVVVAYAYADAVSIVVGMKNSDSDDKCHSVIMVIAYMFMLLYNNITQSLADISILDINH